MGWKTFKEKFNISHSVHITEKGLCIGSPYVHDLIVINLLTGEIRENSTFSNFIRDNYPQLKDASSYEILEILSEIDSFNENFPVYTYKGSIIIESLCEVFGYPNNTHDGILMYDNTFFKTKEEAIQCAIKNNNATLKFYEQELIQTEKKLAEIKDQILEHKYINDNLNKQS